MTIRELQEQMMREFKTNRDIIYDKNNETSNRVDGVSEKESADIAYLAMMLDIDLDDEEEEEVTEDE